MLLIEKPSKVIKTFFLSNGQDEDYKIKLFEELPDTKGLPTHFSQVQ